MQSLSDPLLPTPPLAKRGGGRVPLRPLLVVELKKTRYGKKIFKNKTTDPVEAKLLSTPPPSFHVDWVQYKRNGGGSDEGGWRATVRGLCLSLHVSYSDVEKNSSDVKKKPP